MLSRLRRCALWAAAAGMAAAGWAGVLDPGLPEAAADAPWEPGEPPGPPCDHEGLTPGTPCLESTNHLRRIWLYFLRTDRAEQDLLGLPCMSFIWSSLGSGPIYLVDPDSGDSVYGVRVEQIGHGHDRPSVPTSALDWADLGVSDNRCEYLIAGSTTLHSSSVLPSSPHRFVLGVVPEPACDDHRLLSLRGRPSSNSGSITPSFDPDHGGYYLPLESGDASGWLTAIPRGCATLEWLTESDSTFGSWEIFDVALDSERDVYLWTYSDDTHSDYSVYAVLLARAGCTVDEHYHTPDGCHDHPRPDCTITGAYITIQGTGHGAGTTDVCDDIDPCAAGEHRHGLRTCHDHPRPACTSTGAYTIIVGNGHGTGTTDVCDDPGPTDCSDHQHVDSPGSPGVDANGDGDFDDDGDTAPVPATYLDHAHCQPLCAWPVGAHYLIHDGEGGHDDAYELCPPATSPAVACAVDGVAGLGDAVKVSWTDGSTSSFDLQWRWMRGSQAFGTTQRATSSSSESQISFDTAALDSAFGAAQRGVQVRVSALRYAWSPWATIQCGVSCAAALNRLAGRTHLVAGNVDRAEPYLGAAAHNGGVPLTQVVWPSRRQTIYLIDAGNGTRIEDHPGVAECGGHRVGEWDWDFSSLFTAWTTFTAGHTVAADGCTSGGSYCVYRVIDPAAVDQIFTLQARPVARTKLTGRPVAGTPSTASVLTRAAWIP